MQISELQIALIGAGAVGVVMVWGYNVWQDRQHRKLAERIFNDGTPDALLDKGSAGAEGETEIGGSAQDGLARREPQFVERDEPAAMPAGPCDESTPGGVEPPAAAAAAVRSALPSEWADAVADCALRMVATDPVPAQVVRAMQDPWSGECGKPMHWLVRNEPDGAWRRLAADDSGRYREWVVALQLADRRGPLSDAELGRFFDGVANVAQQIGAAVELPDRAETLLRAASLDDFCAAVDIQFVLQVVEASGGVFAGTKLRGLAEAAGLDLESDGMFRARDAGGGELFSVANLGAERFDPETLKSLATNGLTLSLDVPRVADGVPAFDRMLETARQLAAALGGELVDAQRAPLSAAMIDAIRAKVAELQQRMNDGGIAPGGVRALRLFS